MQQHQQQYSLALCPCRAEIVIIKSITYSDLHMAKKIPQNQCLLSVRMLLIKIVIRNEKKLLESWL